MSLNHEFLANLVRRNADNKTQLILLKLRPLAIRYDWDVETLQHVAVTVCEIVHQSEMQLSATVDELLQDLIARPK